MNGYTVNANDLETFIKHKKKLLNLNKSKKTHSYSTIDNKYISNLCFNETLNIINENEEELGEFNGKVRPCNSNINRSMPSIIVHLHSTSISESGEEIGMSLMANTTTNFHSYEEKWSQWCIKKPELKICKTILISCKNSNEQIQIFTELNGELIGQTYINNLKHNNSLITEGMNYAFLRYLAITGFEGLIKNKMAITINGKLCKTIYECLLKEEYEINKVYIPVVIIKRILYQDKLSKTSNIQLTVLTRSGYIVKHSWGKITNKELMIKKSMKIKLNGNVYNTMSYLNNTYTCDQDIRLKSLYVDKVIEMKNKYKTYMKNNSAVKEIVIDYIKEILVAKPLNVLQFSIDYFEKLK